MTLMLVLVPNVTLSLFSLSWYIDKHYSTNEKEIADQNEQPKAKAASTCDSITFWISTILFVIFQIDLIWKYIQGFIYTVKGWACRSLYKNLAWEKYYIEKQIKCDTDIGMLRLIDVFMDSGPQVLLQLYVITTQNLNELGSANLIYFSFRDFKTTSLEFKQFFSILSSFLSLSYALAGYHRCLRNQQFIFCLEQNKPLPRPMSWFSTIMQFLWYLFLIAPRVLAMAIFASTFRSWFLMIIVVHWFIMYFWILRLKTNFCLTSNEYNAREEIFEKFYDFVCSFIYIFVYFNLKSGATRYRYLIYYLIFYSENLIFSISYFIFSKEINLNYKLSMLLVVIIGFWIAITFQILYYLHYHPSHDIRICVKGSNGCISISNKTTNKLHVPYNIDESSVYNKTGENLDRNSRINNDDSVVFKQPEMIKNRIDPLESNEETLFYNNLNIKQSILYKEKSIFSLPSSSEMSVTSFLSLSKSNFNYASSRILRTNNNLSKSLSNMSLADYDLNHIEPNSRKFKSFTTSDIYRRADKNNYDCNMIQNSAPLASIKELILIEDELSKVKKFLNANRCSLSS
jgi:hypothetical protein